METLLKIVQTVNSYLSDYILIVMLVAAGLFFSIKTRFVQVRYFGAAMRKAFGEVKLFGKKANLIYSVIAIAFIFLGSLLSNDLVWELTDMFNQLMVIPNVIALLALGGLVAASAKAGSSETLENKKK